jgi:transcriptional regulator with XRE-family HTH domain
MSSRCRQGVHSDTPALPFCHLRLRAKKPVNKGYPRELKTIGDHIRKRRLDLGLQQTQVALVICVDKTTIMNWERGHRSPAIWTLPGIIKFLGYIPFELGHTLPERLIGYRKTRGLSRKKLARMLGVDECTLWRWERGDRRPQGDHARRVRVLLPDSRELFYPDAY